MRHRVFTEVNPNKHSGEVLVALAELQNAERRFPVRPRNYLSDPMNYDAILVTSFGGPECPDDVMPFLENVLRGKNVPRERMLEVAEHYYHFGGKSPINDQNRQLIAALEERNWLSTGLACPSIGETATGIPCSPTRCAR
jgi:hypothetical protein